MSVQTFSRRPLRYRSNLRGIELNLEAANVFWDVASRLTFVYFKQAYPVMNEVGEIILFCLAVFSTLALLVLGVMVAFISGPTSFEVPSPLGNPINAIPFMAAVSHVLFPMVLFLLQYLSHVDKEICFTTQERRDQQFHAMAFSRPVTFCIGRATRVPSATANYKMTAYDRAVKEESDRVRSVTLWYMCLATSAWWLFVVPIPMKLAKALIGKLEGGVISIGSKGASSWFIQKSLKVVLSVAMGFIAASLFLLPFVFLLGTAFAFDMHYKLLPPKFAKLSRWTIRCIQASDSNYTVRKFNDVGIYSGQKLIKLLEG